MTYAEKIKMDCEGIAPPAQPLSIPSVRSTVVPPSRYLGPHVGKPKPLDDSDFNHVPLADMEQMHQYKGMDDLHRPDKVAAEYSRGSRLKELAKSLGSAKFKEIYRVINPKK